jgi:hypothetical protein
LRFRKWEAAGVFLFTLALIFLVIGSAMPYYKSPQRLEGTGPGVKFTSSLPYWINSYLIPPIDEGQSISLSVLSDRAGSTTVVLAPWNPDTQAIIGPPLVGTVFGPSQKGLAVFTHATRTGPYLLQITSFNSSYTFYITSVWSPFYQYRTLTTYGLLLLPFGLIIMYYDRLVERREKMAEDALQQIRKKKAA